MIPFTQLTLPAAGIRSLVWDGETLVDWLEGGIAYTLSGKVQAGQCARYSDLNWVVSSPDGQYQALVQRSGTRGVLQRRGEVVRELTRAEYHADAYEYPVTFAPLPNGQTALLHCPHEYNELVVEDVETGKPLAPHSAESADYFFSRLQVTQGGRFLVTAGWFWHPWGTVQVYDLIQGLRRPEHFHQFPPQLPVTGEVSSVAALGSHRVAIATSSEEALNDEPEPQDLTENMLGVYDLAENDWVSRVPMTEELGTLHSFGPWLLSLYGHPKLVDPTTGEIVQRWPELDSGKQASSIIWSYAPPPVAVDGAHLRFAVADERGIAAVQVEE